MAICLNWFVGLDVGMIFFKNMFYSWHGIERWNTAELKKKRSRFKKKCNEPLLNYQG